MSSRMSQKLGDHALGALDDERICDALSAKSTPKSHDQLASKPADDLSHLDSKVKEDYSDPFDECAVLPDADQEEDPNERVITFRSALVGAIMVAVGASISQAGHPYRSSSRLTCISASLFFEIGAPTSKPRVSPACLVLGKFFAAIPGPKWWNPCSLTVKESVFSAIMATAGAGGAHSVEILGFLQIIASLDVFFDRPMPAYLCVLTIMSSQFLGLAWAGSVLPCVVLFRSLVKPSPDNQGQLSLFQKVFGVMTISIPEWLAPALQAISPWCLTLPQLPVVTQIFGGSIAAEGLGLFAASFDWVLVGRYNPLYIPLLAQITDWTAVATGVFLFSAAYRYDWFGGAHLPFISYDILNNEGVRYNLSRALFDNGTENTIEVEKMGLPSYATAFVIGKAGTAFSVSSAIVAALLFNWDRMAATFSSSNPEMSREDPHRTITKHYAGFPMYGFVALGASSIGLAFFCAAQAGSGLPPYALATAFVLSAVLSFAAVFFYGTVGIPLHCQHVTQMLGGILFPGNAISNLWFTLYGWTSVSQCVRQATDLKMGQYMNLSTLSVVIGQISGIILGGFVHYGVMSTIVNTQRDVLLLPHGDGIYTRPAGEYLAIIPYALILGFVAPVPFYLLHRWKPTAGFQRINTSLFAACLYHAVWGATSGRMTSIVLAIATQYYVRKYHFRWYQQYNYILNAALEGGTQFAVLLLTFLVQGGAGVKLNIPQNPRLLLSRGRIPLVFLPTNPGATSFLSHRGPS
ncbi:putative oligopeptide transporter [Melampsora larici-populina 98AG31]|uniref:Putative oligopeptide transporter n=1 Tax=Melampsora larici-populina (strain 98AG31 / pathotype 3-4-7) TaxID=747676 RepID=F4RL57_MELLP|nr:putative oligopeptide transporter [Melampsora larici-populina 98AG31]EGG06846.1 putative oligopeptide transporter [Melampsora larici-populina 98AG31]